MRHNLKVDDPGLQRIIDFVQALLDHSEKMPKPVPHSPQPHMYKVKRGPVVMY